MIRSGCIPPLLDRICTDKIRSALLVTYDGELLGTSSRAASSLNSSNATNNGTSSLSSSSQTALSSSLAVTDPESFGTLVADIAFDYLQLGSDAYAHLDAVPRTKSHLQCLLLQLDQGLIGVSSCVGNMGSSSNKTNATNNNTTGSSSTNPTTGGTSATGATSVSGSTSASSTSETGTASANNPVTANTKQQLSSPMIGCFVIAVADVDCPPGLIKARLQELAVHVQEAFSNVLISSSPSSTTSGGGGGTATVASTTAE